MTLRVGTLCYSCVSGLGLLAKSFYDHGIVNQMCIIQHAHHETHTEWYPPGTPVVPIRQMSQHPHSETVRDFVRGLDVFLAFETPFDFNLLPFCWKHGVKTAIMTMMECSLKSPPFEPDLYLCPSLLDLQYFPRKSVFLPVPVEVPWRQRERARVFVHNAGNGSFRDRNGTDKVLDAWSYVRSDAELIVRTQKPLAQHFNSSRAGLVPGIRCGTVPYETLWDEGDVFLFPESFNGLSLPLQEARAAGMLVMGSDRFPMTTWLPREPLVPVAEYRRASIGPAFLEFDEAVVDPRDIAAKIDAYFDADISEYSRTGKDWAASMSWDVLGPKYRKALEELAS